jgi:hypothetical protein
MSRRDEMAAEAKDLRRQQRLDNMEAAVANLRAEIVRTADLDRRALALAALEDLRVMATAELREGEPLGSAAA